MELMVGRVQLKIGEWKVTFGGLVDDGGVCRLT